MLPPDMMAALGGGAGDPGMGPAGQPAAPAAPDSGGGQRSTTDILKEMISSAKEYLATDADPEDHLTMTKVLTQLQQYLAEEQKEQDDLLQGKASPKALRRASSGPAA